MWCGGVEMVGSCGVVEYAKWRMKKESRIFFLIHLLFSIFCFSKLYFLCNQAFNLSPQTKSVKNCVCYTLDNTFKLTHLLVGKMLLQLQSPHSVWIWQLNVSISILNRSEANNLHFIAILKSFYANKKRKMHAIQCVSKDIKHININESPWRSI